MKEQTMDIKIINQNNLLLLLLISKTKKTGFQTDFYHGCIEHSWGENVKISVYLAVLSPQID